MKTHAQKIRGASAKRDLKARRVGKARASFTCTLLFLFAVLAPALSVRAEDDIANEYRLTLPLHHAIRGDFTGFGQLEYRNNPEKDYQAYEVLWPGLTYSVEHWLQLSLPGLTIQA